MATQKKWTCKGCGKTLDESDGNLVRIVNGNANEDSRGSLRFKTSDQWGHMHERCFKIAIRDPGSIDMFSESA